MSETAVSRYRRSHMRLFTQIVLQIELVEPPGGEDGLEPFKFKFSFSC